MRPKMSSLFWLTNLEKYSNNSEKYQNSGNFRIKAQRKIWKIRKILVRPKKTAIFFGKILPKILFPEATSLFSNYDSFTIMIKYHRNIVKENAT